MKNIKLATLIPIFALLGTAQLTAELPGGATQKRLQAAAEEKLTIEIAEVSKKSVQKGEMHLIEIAARGKALDVSKTTTGIEKGDLVEIRYSILDEEKSPPRGGGTPGLIEKGVRYQAFLTCKDPKLKTYAPCASGGSFLKVATAKKK